MRKPSFKAIILTAFTLFFCLAMVVPAVFPSADEGWDISHEGRAISIWPALYDAEGELNSNWREDFELWLGDHLSFRSEFVKLRADVYMGLLGKSSSEDVYKGKDGWLFYTNDNNLELVTGGFPLTEWSLKRIAQNQQDINDYYKAQGIDYILALTPSKATIYPELLYGEHSVGETAIDVLTRYLEEHTDVTVVNLKPPILEAKGEGQQVYWKTDTHWNGLGAYAGYKELLTVLNEKGAMGDAEPVKTSIKEGAFETDLIRILGSPSIYNEEQGPTLEWNAHTEMLSAEDETLPDNLAAVSSRGTLFKNSQAQGRLLLYGDSFTETHRVFTPLLAEHFGELYYERFTGIPGGVNMALDAAFKPDVVVYSRTERLIKSVQLVGIPNVARIVEEPDFLDLPVLQDAANLQKYYNGIVVDTLNNKPAIDKEQRFIRRDLAYNTIRGWALDTEAVRPLRALYVQVGDTYIKCEYGGKYRQKRADIAKEFRNKRLTYTGFQVSIPTTLLKDVDTVSFIAVGTQGIYRLPDVPFTFTE
jgi:hypothetical protein